MARAARHVQPYPPVFRAEAIRLARSSVKSQRQIADDLGVTSETPCLWLKQADLDTGKRSDRLTTDEHEELRRLQRVHCILRGEREILKKAVALSRTGDRRDPIRVYTFVEREQAAHPVRRMCRLCAVSPGEASGRGGGASHLLASVPTPK